MAKMKSYKKMNKMPCSQESAVRLLKNGLEDFTQKNPEHLDPRPLKCQRGQRAKKRR